MRFLKRFTLMLFLGLLFSPTSPRPVFAIPIQLSDFSPATVTEGFDAVPLLSPIPSYSDFTVIGIGGTPTAVNDSITGLEGDFFPTSAPIVIGMDGQGITNGKSVKFVFQEAVFQVGVQLVDVEDPGATISIYDLGGNFLESTSIAPQGASGLSQFYGIQHDGIGFLVVSTTSSEGIAVDDLTYTPISVVPEPSTFLFLALGLVGLTWSRRVGNHPVRR